MARIIVNNHVRIVKQTTAVAAAPAADAPKQPAPCSVWGPTCDGIDCVIADAKLPSELPVGGWLYFPDMGAYTSCAGSNFNGMALPDVVYLQARGEHAKPQPPPLAAAAMLKQLKADGVIVRADNNHNNNNHNNNHMGGGASAGAG